MEAKKNPKPAEKDVKTRTKARFSKITRSKAANFACVPPTKSNYRVSRPPKVRVEQFGDFHSWNPEKNTQVLTGKDVKYV